MTYTMYVPIDANAVYAAEYEVFQTSWEHNFGFDVLFEVESENEDHDIDGLDHLRKALIAVQLYPLLAGFKWKNVKELVYENKDSCGAYVEFASEADAMLWKLAHGGEQ